ncbi:MAG: DUF1579 family protein [Planctomycetes bacterium]|nr:DUF1579 family protein [Planctomycetota bacterium]
MNRKTWMAGAIAGALLVGVVAVAQDKKKEGGAAAMTMPKPAPELQKLAFLVGKWSGEETHFATEMMPAGKGQGTFETSFDLDGFFVHFQIHSKTDAMTYAAHGLLTWDAKTSQYSEWWFDNFGTVTQYIGTVDGDKFVMTADVDYMGKKTKERVTFTKVSATQLKFVLEGDAGKGFQKEIETTYTKQAGT